MSWSLPPSGADAGVPGQTNVVVRGVGRHANSPILWVRIHGSFDDIMDREPAIKSIGRAENADTAWARLEEFEIERGQALSGDRSGLRVRSLSWGPCLGRFDKTFALPRHVLGRDQAYPLCLGDVAQIARRRSWSRSNLQRFWSQ